MPARVLRFGVSAGWHARLLQLDPGWIDLAKRVPLLDTGRARAELGWSPTRTGPEVLREVITGMTDAAYGDSPVLRSRTVGDQVGRAFRERPRRPSSGALRLPRGRPALGDRVSVAGRAGRDGRHQFADQLIGDIASNIGLAHDAYEPVPIDHRQSTHLVLRHRPQRLLQ